MSDEELVLSWESSDGAIGASQRRVGRSGRVSSEDAKRKSARDLQNQSAGGRDAQPVDQGKVWATPVQRARVSQGGDGGVVGVSHLQHPSVDTSLLETSDRRAVACVEKEEKRACSRENRPVLSHSTVCIRIIAAQIDFFLKRKNTDA